MRPNWRPLRLTSARSDKDSAAAAKEVDRAASRQILPKIAGEQPCESSRRLRRRGEKIPATGRAMTDRFLVVDGPAPDRQGPGLFGDRTRAGTLRTRLTVAEELELAAEDLFDGAAGQGLGHIDGQ